MFGDFHPHFSSVMIWRWNHQIPQQFTAEQVFFSYSSEFRMKVTPYFKTMNHLFLLGGWTNPSEKYDRQIGSFPQGSGVKIKNWFKPPASFHAFKFNFHPQRSTEGPTTPRSLPFLPELRGENCKNGCIPRAGSLPFKNRSHFFTEPGIFHFQ